MVRGMLDLFDQNFKNLQQQDQNDERELQTASADPFRAMAQTAYTSASLAGKGLGKVVAAGFGRDGRSAAEKNTDAIAKVKEQVAALGFNPDDPKSIDAFYKKVIEILSQQGLVAEAMAVTQEYRAEKSKTAEQDLKVGELQRKKDRDAALNASSIRRDAELAKRDVGPETLQLLRALDGTDDPAKRTAILQRLNYLSERSPKPLKYVDLGDRVSIRDAAGNEIGSEEKGLSPKDDAKAGAKDNAVAQAYAEAVAGLQHQYDAAVALHNHKGVPGITGRLGYWVGDPDKSLLRAFVTMTLAKDDALGALAKHEQVQGGAFLAGLTKLKQASKTGATGLGAVSDTEGGKVQADAAALNRAQTADSYRQQLAIYVHEMEGFAQRMAAAAKSDGLDPLPLTPRQLMLPRGRTASPGATPAPAPGATPAPSAAPGAERWERDPATGKMRKVQ